jgi:hypothetical protein
MRGSGGEVLEEKVAMSPDGDSGGGAAGNAEVEIRRRTENAARLNMGTSFGLIEVLQGEWGEVERFADGLGGDVLLSSN